MSFGPLVILGDPEVGKFLVARTGGVVKYAEHGPVLEEDFAWYSEGKAIPNANASSYKVRKEDAGKEIHVEYSFRTNSGSYTVRSKPDIIKDDRIDTLRVLYTYLLSRAPDKPGLAFWTHVLETYENQGNSTALGDTIIAFQSSEAYRKELGL